MGDKSAVNGASRNTSQLVETFVAGRGKYGYLTGNTKQLARGDSSYDNWVMDNAIVKGWLISAMEPDVMNLFIRLPTAKGVDRYLVHDLSRKAMQMRQIGRSLAAYYVDLSAL
ncbi:hypothetical protein L3X38_030878 [Prunus dulcis]|uniref:Uncharacterized protein n=2 Tax=Prunus dulcis TaxID=3755 RepID=A0AAD4VCA3_PRUDU|nr:hypothetical protein L3X38_030878 [Prunus dulcis]